MRLDYIPTFHTLGTDKTVKTINSPVSARINPGNQETTTENMEVTERFALQSLSGGKGRGAA
jgi:hypothetical protein